MTDEFGTVRSIALSALISIDVVRPLLTQLYSLSTELFAVILYSNNGFYGFDVFVNSARLEHALESNVSFAGEAEFHELMASFYQAPLSPGIVTEELLPPPPTEATTPSNATSMFAWIRARERGEPVVVPSHAIPVRPPEECPSGSLWSYDVARRMFCRGTEQTTEKATFCPPMCMLQVPNIDDRILLLSRALADVFVTPQCWVNEQEQWFETSATLVITFRCRRWKRSLETTCKTEEVDDAKWDPFRAKDVDVFIVTPKMLETILPATLDPHAVAAKLHSLVRRRIAPSDWSVPPLLGVLWRRIVFDDVQIDRTRAWRLRTRFGWYFTEGVEAEDDSLFVDAGIPRSCLSVCACALATGAAPRRIDVVESRSPLIHREDVDGATVTDLQALSWLCDDVKFETKTFFSSKARMRLRERCKRDKRDGAFRCAQFEAWSASSEACVICMEATANAMLSCGHLFCVACAIRLRAREACAMCRAPFRRMYVTPETANDGRIAKVLAACARVRGQRLLIVSHWPLLLDRIARELDQKTIHVKASDRDVIAVPQMATMLFVTHTATLPHLEGFDAVILPHVLIFSSPTVHALNIKKLVRAAETCTLVACRTSEARLVVRSFELAPSVRTRSSSRKDDGANANRRHAGGCESATSVAM